MTKKKEAQEAVEIADQLSILPLRNAILFPGAILPIDVGRRKSVKLIEDILTKERPVIGILAQRDARTEDPTGKDLYQIGTAAKVLKVIKISKDNFSVVLQGVSRFKVGDFTQSDPFLVANITSLPDPLATDMELDTLVTNLKEVARKVIKLMPELPKETMTIIESVTDSGQLSDLVSGNLDIQLEEKQDVLETLDRKERVRKVIHVAAGNEVRG